MAKHIFTINEYVVNQYIFNSTEEEEKIINEIGLEEFLQEKLSLGEVFENSEFEQTIEYIESEQDTIRGC